MTEIGLAASIIAVIQISEDVITRAYNYGKAVKAAKKDMDKIQGEIENLKKTLTKLKDLAQIAETSGQSLTLWPTLIVLQSKESPLHGCQSSLESLQPELAPVSFLEKFKVRAQWPHTQKKVNAALQSMVCQKDLLIEALNIDQASQILSTGHAVHNIAEAQVEQQEVSLSTNSKVTELKDENVIRWLISTDPSVNQVAAIDKHEKYTGKWLFEDQRYISWNTATHGFLWIHGPSGCGKTILCSTIIENTLTHITPMNRKLLAYYYFDITDREKQTVSSLLRSVLGQICDKMPAIPNVVLTLHSTYKPGNPPRQALIDTLTSLLPDIDQVYICIDALDECSEKRELFALLKHLYKCGPDNIRLLVTSQDQQQIKKSMDGLITETIDVQGSLHNLDIELYIRESVTQGGKLEEWASHPVKKEIQSKLCSGAHGSFRWVSCQIDSLCKCLSEDDIMETLGNLPSTLNETYGRILCKIAGEGPAIASKIHRVLQWLAFSRRPLSLKEAAEASAIDPNGQMTTSSRLHRPHIISDICSSLVVVASDGYALNQEKEDEEEKIQLAHPSVQRYLVSQQLRLSQPPVSEFAFTEADAHTLMAGSCIRYILQFGMQFGDSHLRPIQSRLAFPLCLYAVRYWPEHYALIPEEARETSVERLAIELLDDRFQRPAIFVHRFGKATGKDSFYHISRYGLIGLVTKFLERGANVDEKNERGESPLQVATIGGHLDTVKLLLDHKAEISYAGYSGYPLTLAGKAGHVDIVQLLLDQGADINAVDESGLTALHWACERGYEKTMQLLLDKGDNINTSSISGRTPLHMASRYGYRELVQLLLDNGADLDAVDMQGLTALHWAVKNGHRNGVQLLLDKGADTNAVDRQGLTVLHVAAEMGRPKIMQLLLEKRVDINAVDQRGRTALHLASQQGYEKIVQLLLDEGAGTNAVDEKGLTALHLAAEDGDARIVQLLVDRGADINVVGDQGLTALHLAADYGNGKTVQMLLDKGADINAVDGQGFNALDLADQNDRGKIVQLLSDRGAARE